MATNPILTELSQLSPAAQQVLVQAHGAMGGPGATAGGATQPPLAAPRISAPTNDPPPPAPNLTGMGGSSMPSLQAPAPPNVVKAPPPGRGTLEGDEAERSRLLSTGSGISQIHSKIESALPNHPTLGKVLGYGAQIPAQIAEAAGSMFAPVRTAEMLLPGTQAHHALELRNLNDVIGKESTEGVQSAQAGEQKALTGQHETEAAQIPVAAQRQQTQLDSELAQHGLKLDTATGKIVPQPPEEQSAEYKADIANKQAQTEGLLHPFDKLAGNQPLDNVDALNKAMGDRYAVLNPGKPLPSEFTLPANAKQSDYDRVDKALAGVESAQGTKDQRDQTAELRKQTAEIAAQNRADKTDTTLKKQVYTAYTPVMDSAERFNVMSKNYEDAVNPNNKNPDQQAMLSLLANHLGMTMGLAKGARITQALYKEAENTRPWLAGVQARWSGSGPDAYLTGVVLSKDQMQQMVNNARGRYSEDVGKARNEAQYLGAQDDGPSRTPNSSTINYYMGQTGGDVNKAKALAAQDGWTVK